MMMLHLVLYIAAFLFVWIGSGMIVSSTVRFSRKLRLSSFAFSFAVLGILTSIPEFSVGMQAVAIRDPEIFVGNLIGGVAFMFLVIIPLLAFFGGGINLKHELSRSELVTTLVVVLLPSLMVIDHRVTNLEGVVCVAFYFFLLYTIERRQGFLDGHHVNALDAKSYSVIDLLKVVGGVGIVFVASRLIVENTLYFADMFNIPAYYISLFVVTLGTNLPELSLAIRAVVTKKQGVALGDYMGSAAANTLLFGGLTILHNGEVLTVNNFFLSFVFIAGALGMFLVVSVTDNFISRKNALLLLGIYVLFVVVELLVR